MSAATSLTEQNRAIVEAMFEAANKGDVEGVLSYLSDDVTVNEPLFLPFGSSPSSRRPASRGSSTG